eukprot:gene468-496_t
MSTTLNTISNTTTQNSHNNNNNNEYYTPTLPQLTKAVEYAEEQEERGWREVEGDLNSLYAGKDLTEETLSELIKKVHDTEKYWETEIKRAVDLEKKRLASMYQDMTYEMKSKDTELAYLQGSAVELDIKMKHAGFNDTDIRSLVESNNDKLRMTLLTVIQKLKDLKNSCVAKKAVDDREGRLLEDMLLELKVDSSTGATVNSGEPLEVEKNVLVKFGQVDRMSRLDTDLAEKLQNAQKEDKAISVAIDRVKMDVAQESAALRHQINTLRDKSDALSVRLKELEEKLLPSRAPIAESDHSPGSPSMRGFGKDVGLGFGRAMHNQSYHGMNLNASNSNNVENRKDSNVVKRRHQRGKRGSPKNQKQSSGRRKAKKAKAQHDEYGIPMVEDSDGVVADQP